MTEREESPGGNESSEVSAATPTVSRVSQLLAWRLADSCADSDPKVRARAHRARCSGTRPPPGCAISTPPNRK